MTVSFQHGPCGGQAAGHAPAGVPAAAIHPKGSVDRAIDCFASGTLVTTRRGKRPVERLRPGDMLLTRDSGFQPLLWRGMRPAVMPPFVAGAKPVLIRAGALGPGQPERDMIVSASHRLLSTDAALLRGFGEPEALIEAHVLAGRPGIGHVAPDAITYVHLLMDRHEVILAENTWTESFRLTPSVLRKMAGAGLNRLERAMPHLSVSAHVSVHARARETVQAPARLCLSAAAAAQPLGA